MHLLVEDLDLDGGWLHVRNKPHLGWRTKSRREKSVPLHNALIAVLQSTIDGRSSGPVFLPPNLVLEKAPLVTASEKSLTQELQRRVAVAERAANEPLTRETMARIARTVWRDAGATKPDAIRTSFIRLTDRIGLPEVTCPKAWRHTFATLLQDANVDPLVRQITMGHAPSSGPDGALGMTSHYTHTRPVLRRARSLVPWSCGLHPWSSHDRGQLSARQKSVAEPRPQFRRRHDLPGR